MSRVVVAQPVSKHSKSASNSSSPPSSDLLDASLLLSVDNVQVYSLAEGEKKLLATGKLQIVTPKSTELSSTEEELIIFLAPGNIFQLSLRPEIPVLEMTALNFIFPRPDSTETYGIVLPESVGEEELELLILLLHENSSFSRAAISQEISLHKIPVEERKGQEGQQGTLVELKESTDIVVKTAYTVSKGLNSHADTFVRGINQGAAKISSYIAESGTYIKRKLKPNEKPSVVSADTKNRLKQAKVVSGAAVKISKVLVATAVATANGLSNQLSAQISETSIGKSLQQKPSERVEAGKQVAKSTISAIAAISSSLLDGGLTLISALGNATADIVQHKYGVESGIAAQQAAGIVKDLATTAVQMEQVGVKSIIKKTVRSTAIQVCSTEEEKQLSNKSAASNSVINNPGIALQVLNEVHQVRTVLQESQPDHPPSNQNLSPD
jgi:hypothetical protein